MQFTVIFSTDNNAFEQAKDESIENVFAEIVKKVKAGFLSGTIRDTNGNKIGFWDWET